MKNKVIIALLLLCMSCFITNVFAEDFIQDIIYGEDIKEGEEEFYAFLENETILDAYKDLTEEEANSLKVTIEASGYTTVVIKSYMVKTDVLVDSFEHEFSSYEEALAYVDYLEQQGIVVSNIEFINDTDVLSDSISETFVNLEDAKNALKEFEEEFNENLSKELKENRTEEVLQFIEGTTSYETYEDAENALNGFLNAEENNTDEFYFTGVVVGAKGNGTYTFSEINEEFNSKEEALSYLENLESLGYIIIDSLFTNDTKVEKDSLNKTFNTKEEALAALKEFEEEFALNLLKEITENKTQTVLESVNGTTSYETYEDAENALNSFLNAEENNTDEFYFTGVVVGPKGNGTYTTTEINEQFNSKEEALNYLEELEELGYIIIEYTFTNDTKVEKDSLNKTFNTKEEALAALKEFEEEFALNLLKEITENKTQTVLESVNGTTSYETYEDAENALNSFLNAEENNTDEFYFTGVVVGPKGNGTYTTTEINEEFNSKEEALNYLEELEELGYIIIEYTFTNDTKVEKDSLNKTFDNIEEARKALADFVAEFKDNVSKEITENKTQTVLESVNGTTSYETYEDAENALNSFLNAEENNTDEFYFTGVVVGPKGNGTYTTTEINEQFNSKEEALNYLEELEELGYIIIEYTFTNDTKVEKGSITEIFNSIEEANNRLNKFEEEFALNLLKEITENKTQTVIEKINGTTSYETYEDAENALNSFLNAEENNTDEFYFTGVVVGPKGNGTYTTTEINEQFNSKEEALNYLEELEKLGYIIVNYTYTNDTKVEKDSISEIFDTEEEANNRLDEFEEEFSDNTDSNIEKIYNSDNNTLEDSYVTDEYTSKSELQAIVKEETDKSNEDYLITGSISSRTESSPIESKIFDTEEEAQAYINSFKSQGYDVNDIKNEILHYQDGYWVTELGVKIEQSQMNTDKFNYHHFDVTLQTSFTQIDLEGNSKTVTGTITIDEVIISGNKISMSGPSYDNNTKLYEYTSVERNKLNINNSTFAQISGYITLSDGTKLPFKLEGYLNEDNNVCGGRYNTKGYDLEFGKIKIIEKKVYIESNLTQKYYVSGNKSKTFYKAEISKYVKDYDYKLTASGEKTVTLDSGVLSGSKKLENQGYFFDVEKKAKTYTVNASGEKIVTLDSGVLSGSKKIENQGYFFDVEKKAKTYTVNASGEKIVTLDSGVLSGSKKIENQGYFFDVEKKAKTYTVNASGEKIVTLDSGVLSGSKKIENQGYFFDVEKKAKTYTVNASGEKIVTLDSGVLSGSKKIENQGYFFDVEKKAKTYTVNASGEKTVTLDSGILKANTERDIFEEFYSLDLIKQKYQFIGGIGGDEVENPQTGDKSLFMLVIAYISMVGLAITGKYLRK